MEGSADADVLIIGGGLAGILCAYQLRQKNVSCILLEADRVMHGVSRNTTAKITSQHGLLYGNLIKRFGREGAKLYWQANQEALGHYCRLAREIPCDLEMRDHYVYSVSDPSAPEREWKALDSLGIPVDLVEKLEIPVQTCGAVRFRDQAQFHPLKLAQGLLPGLPIYENTAVKAFDGKSVVTDWGRVTAKKIIVATHFPIFNKHGLYFMKMYQERSYVMALEGAEQLRGMYLDGSKGGLSFRSYGDMLLLGGGSHRTGKHGNGWLELETFQKNHYPVSREVYRWAAQDCMTLDGIPYIGRYSSTTPELYVATGFNKWGITSSMVAAEVLTDLVTERENPYAAVFSPQRTMLRPQLLANGLEAVGNLLTPTRPRCPHMGCALKWNPWEHSWDCPCHGSRFSEDGTLLDNPAAGNLKEKQE